MSPARARRAALLLALGLGVLGDVLLRVGGEPGANLPLWSAGGLVAIAVLRLGRGGVSGEVKLLLVGAFLFSAALAWRDAPALRALNLLVAAGTVLLAGGAGEVPWLRRAGVVGYAYASLTSVAALAAGPVLLMAGAGGPRPARRWSRPLLAVLRGALVALPLLLLFGGLLMAADPVFEGLVTGTLSFDPERVLEHVLFAAPIAWLSAGYLSRYVDTARGEVVQLPLPRVQLGLLDGAVALGLLNALFLAFVLVQLRYLFGGAALVEVTPGLGYADYARRGFFELVAVAALVVPVLLAADWCVRRERPLDQWLFRGFALGQVLLLFAILASAYYRMRLYRQTYGLTELRFFTTAFMLWTGFVLAWLAVTVLRGRRQLFASGALLSALAAALLLNVANPHARIARTNAEDPAVRPRYDVAYASRLSGDAVPALLATLPLLPSAARCTLAGALLEQWLPPRAGGWRTFNHGDWRARRAVRAARRELEALPCARS